MRSIGWLSVLLFAGVAAAQTKPRAACGIKAFPLAVGNTWTFSQSTAPEAPDERRKLYIPAPYKDVSLTVSNIESVGNKTIVSLTETTDGKSIQTKLECSAAGVDISPDSMLASGAPGGALGIEVTNVVRKHPTWKVTGGALRGQWLESLTATWKRSLAYPKAATGGEGTLELEHQYVVAPDEAILWGQDAPAMRMAHRVNIAVTGRVQTGPEAKKQELPAANPNAIWFADGVGPVQFLNNNFYHQYTLVAFKSGT